MLLTRQPNISASAAVCTPAASFDNAVWRRTHGSPSLEKQPVGDNKHGTSLRYGPWRGGKSFPASRALIRTMLVVLRPIYLVAGLPRKRYSLLTGLLVLMFSFLSGCASMDAVKKAAGIKDPTVSIAGMNISTLSAEGLTLQFVLDVDNPNPIPLNLAGFDYALMFDGKQLMAGEQRDKVNIKARDSSQVKVPVSLKFSDLSRLISGAMNKDSLGYELKTAALVDLPVIGIKKFPATKKGTFPVPKAPDISLTGIDIKKLSLTGAKVVIGANIDNPNAFGVDINKLIYNLSINGKQWAKSDVDKTISLSGKGSSSLNIPLELNFVEMGSSLYQLLMQGKGMNYNLTGDMKFDAGHPLLKDVDAPFSKTGVVGTN